MLVDYMEDKEKNKASHEQQPTITDELNAMQYACGYVPHKLLKRYETRRGGKVKTLCGVSWKHGCSV